jgi:hypothetical protein
MLNLNTTQQQALTAIVAAHANIEGSYSTTMLHGIACYKCSSGIVEDAFSIDDSVFVNKHLAHLTKNEDNLETYYAAIFASGLQFVHAINALEKFALQNNLCEESVASLAAQIEESN